MAVYKEEKTGTWRVIYRYTDWTGEKKQTQKRGFQTKREAQAWEREQLNKARADLDMFFRLVKQMAEREGVTEQLKADNQMEWVARMNNIRSRATEIVNHDIIYELTENGGREIDFPLLPFSTVTVEKITIM